jgi:hypothetical protein
MPPSEPIPSAPFYLIVADHDRGFFSVEGPMTDNASWNQGWKAQVCGFVR